MNKERLYELLQVKRNRVLALVPISVIFFSSAITSWFLKSDIIMCTSIASMVIMNIIYAVILFSDDYFTEKRIRDKMDDRSHLK